MSPIASFQANWHEIDALLDEALDLPEDDRRSWLDSLRRRRPEMGDLVARLLQARSGPETDDFLESLPQMAGLALDELQGSTAPGALSAGARVGPWELIEELGRGGMGSVWRAERADGAFRRTVALKLPWAQFMPGLDRRMARERDILATLEHPAIARLYDAGVDEFGRPWLALERVEGMPIDAFARQQGLDTRRRVRLLVQVCEAVAYAHSRLVVHRDLKPSNILVNAASEVRLLDFGISRLLDQPAGADDADLTAQVGAAMTLDYASPEQILGLPLSTSSDLYSLGVVAYELLTGSRPYRMRPGSIEELRHSLAEIAIAPPSRQVATRAETDALRGGLDAVVLQCLRQRPEQRYPTVQALADDLVRWLQDEPLQARPERWLERAARTVRRHRTMAVASALSLAAVLGGAGVALWQAREALAAAQRAESARQLLVDAFQQADSSRGTGIDTRAVDVLKAARETFERRRVAEGLPPDPVGDLDLLTTLAYSLVGLGALDDARITIDSALKSTDGLLPDTDRRRVIARVLRGEIAAARGQAQEAVSQLSSVVVDAEAVGEWQWASRGYRFLSTASIDLRDFAAARQAVDRAVALRAAHPRSIDATESAHVDGAVANLSVTQRAPDALARAQEALASVSAVTQGRPSIERIASRSRVGLALSLSGRPAEAVAMLQDSLQEALRAAGRAHPVTQGTLNYLGNAQLALGDGRGALKTFSEHGQPAAPAEPGTPTVFSALTDFNRGVAADLIGDDEAALRHWQAAARQMSQAAGADAPQTAQIRAQVAGALARVDQLDAAQALLDELASRPGRTPRAAAVEALQRSEVMRRRNQAAQAQALLNEAQGELTRPEAPARVHHAWALAHGASALEAGQPEEARTSVEALIARLQADHPAGSATAVRARLLAGRIELRLNRPARAGALLQEAGDMAAAAGLAPRLQAETRLWLAAALLAQGSRAQGLQMQQEALGALPRPLRWSEATALSVGSR